MQADPLSLPKKDQPLGISHRNAHGGLNEEVDCHYLLPCAGFGQVAGKKSYCIPRAAQWSPPRMASSPLPTGRFGARKACIPSFPNHFWPPCRVPCLLYRPGSGVSHPEPAALSRRSPNELIRRILLLGLVMIRQSAI